MPIVKLTDDFIGHKLLCPDGKRRIEYVSDQRTGLYIEVRSTSQGQGTYYLRYKDSTGKTCHHRIGKTTEISLEAAQFEVKRLRAEITLGNYPGQKQPESSQPSTFADFFHQHYLPFAKPRKRSWRDDEAIYRLRLKKHFAHLPLEKITRKQIMDMHTALKEQGLQPATCNHAIKLIRRCLNLAVEWEMLKKNPASKIQMLYEDNKVEHYMDVEQLARLLEVLRTDSNRTVCQIILFLLSTGQRMGSVLRARWDQVNLEKQVWKIPASNSKSKRLISVPLNDTALGVLEEVNTEKGYIFLNQHTGMPYTTIQKVWRRLRAKAGLHHLRLHDLRHQYASFLVNSGRTLYEVQQILGHANPKVTQRYAHLSTKSLQDAANSASDAINGAMK